MATIGAQKRLAKEYKALNEEPVPFIYARPDEADILSWHYIITGPPDTPYAEGQYHGMLMFPPSYPFKPPGIKMITPNGRFIPNTKLCLTISDYHPEQWNPAWSVGTILNGLLSFMTSDDFTSGSMRSTDLVKRGLAKASKSWNTTKNTAFMRVLPDFALGDGTGERRVAEQGQLAKERRRQELKRKLNKDTTPKATPEPNPSEKADVAGVKKPKLDTSATVIVLSDEEDVMVPQEVFEDDFYDDFEVSDSEPEVVDMYDEEEVIVLD